MKRTLILLFVLVALFARAEKAIDTDLTYRQSDGTSITVKLIGDEYFHIFTTLDGYTLSRTATGDFHYKTPGGVSGIMAHNANQRTPAEQAFISANASGLTLAANFSTSARRNAIGHPKASDRSTNIAHTGSPRVAVVLANFKDIKLKSTSTVAAFSDKYTNGSKSARQYFIDQSGGKFSPQIDVLGPVTVSKNRAYYGTDPTSGNSHDTNKSEFVQEVINLLNTDLSQYDNDGDGDVDSFIIVYAGPGQSHGAAAETIWPCHMNSYMGSKNGVDITDVVLICETAGSSDSETALNGIGTFCHEFSHTLGLPDFYDTENSGDHYGMGYWSIMNSGNYNDDMNTPAGYTAFEKSVMDWMEIPVATGRTQYTLKSMDQTGASAVKIYNDQSTDEFYILECHRKAGWYAFNRAEGLLVTHVTYDQAEWVSNDVNINDLQGCTIIPADNLLTKSSENGDLYPYNGNNSLTDTSTPAATLNFGNKSKMGKPITDITYSNGQSTFWFWKDATVLESGDLAYKILTEPTSSSWGTASVTGLSTEGKAKSSLSLTIPAEVTIGGKDYKVREIASNAFYNVTSITSVNIKYGCKEIGSYAFNNCTSMTFIRMPSSINSIKSYALYGCSALRTIYIAKPTPPTTSTNALPSTRVNISLYVPKTDANSVNNYKNSSNTEWKNMKSYAKSSSAYDVFCNDGAYLCVTKEPTFSTNGEMSLVGFSNSASRVANSSYKPSSGSTYRFYGYAFDFTTIADSACYNNTNIKGLDLSGCSLMTRIGEGAFSGCTNLTSVTFGPGIKRIEQLAFNNAPIANDLIMPYGFQYLGYRAFHNVKSKRMLIPGSFSSCNTQCFYGMSSLTELIINSPSPGKSTWSFDLTNVPSSCKVLVPTGQVQQYRNHTNWKKFGNNITAGAFDFVYGTTSWTKVSSSAYHMTVTSTTPVTVDGVTYDGKAKYVYNPGITTKTSFSPSNYETDNTYDVGKKYLITEVGDSCFYNASGITTVALTNMKNLNRVGAYAFTGSGVKQLTVPECCAKFGNRAFYGAASLEDLTIQGTGSHNWDGQFIGNNASNFTMYVHFQNYPGFYNSSLGGWTIGSKKGTDILNPYITSDNNTLAFATLVPIDFTLSGVNAYIVNAYNTANATLTTKKVERVPGETGVIITGISANTIYKLKRPTSSVSSPGTNYLVSSAAANTDVYTKTVGYYWNRSSKKFVKPTASFMCGTGRSYLLLGSAAAGTNKTYFLDIFPGTSTKKGDVNADGKIDIVDLNIVINIVLGSDQASNYNGRADVNSDSKIDIVDVNAIINLILGGQ